MTTQTRLRFHELHDSGTFVMPNPWDAGSARLLQHLGFQALATTSSGLAASLGRADQHVALDELVHHVATLVAAVAIPISVDAEHGYTQDAGDVAGVARTAELLAEAGAAGLSIEDYDPVSRSVLPPDLAARRVEAAAQVAARHGMVLTARAENHLYGHSDLDDTITRLRAYGDAGAGASLNHEPEVSGNVRLPIRMPAGGSMTYMSAMSGEPGRESPEPDFVARARQSPGSEHWVTIGLAWTMVNETGPDGLAVRLHTVPTSWDGNFILVQPS